MNIKLSKLATIQRFIEAFCKTKLKEHLLSHNSIMKDYARKINEKAIDDYYESLLDNFCDAAQKKAWQKVYENML